MAQIAVGIIYTSLTEKVLENGKINDEFVWYSFAV